ncbi:MAG: DNA methyltransferase [Candidatus Omnitrophica bacterium]|nr:DNA methyltransferase [Candidatus Omnitrophota bacterium]
MRQRIIKVTELPEDTSFNSVFEITSNNVNYYTHGFFKYPCKFIPHIPRWAIKKYSKEGDVVLDPFCGSGTTLLEAVTLNRIAAGIDFDPLSRLISRTKTYKYTKKDIRDIEKIREKISKGKLELYKEFVPDFSNISHWFPPQSIRGLSFIKSVILNNSNEKSRVRDFLMLCLASTVRKCSFADDTSPKPYVSKRIKKSPLNPSAVFIKILDNYLNELKDNQGLVKNKCFIIGGNAKKINRSRIKNYTRQNVSLAVTSPPYINAFDYVRSLRLENIWLGHIQEKEIPAYKERQFGTEAIPVRVYNKEAPSHFSVKLDMALKEIYKKDGKRAFVVSRFFNDMQENIKQVYSLLKNGGHYVIVVGNSQIRDVDIPTSDVIIDIAKKENFRLVNLFSYRIKNRYLRIPRKGRGGLIKEDWVIALEK